MGREKIGRLPSASSPGTVCGAKSLGLACAAVVLSVMSAGQALAVQTPAKIGDPGLRDPHTPSSIPNISGMWFSPVYNRRVQPVDGSEPPWQPWTKAEFDKRQAAEAAGTPLFDPTAFCMPSGIPRVIVAPYPFEIVQTPDKLIFLYETQHLFRVVYMNATHPKDIKPSFFGDEVGRWEGDTLVIDSVGMTTQTQVDESGAMHSDALHMIERIRLNGKQLEELFTIDDPKAYTKPWTAKRVFVWRPDVRHIEYVCEENNRNTPDENGQLKHF
jgi:hypothetical protein